MKNRELMIGGGYRWLKGFGLGFRIIFESKCSTYLTFSIQFANIEVHQTFALLKECDGSCEKK